MENREFDKSRALLTDEIRFGAYSVALRAAGNLCGSLRDGLGLAPGDSYLEVHVPDSVEGAPKAVLGAFREGFVLLADYLLRNRLRPKCLIGVTHRNVALPARRFLNFRVISGIPEDMVDRAKARRITDGYAQTKRARHGVPRGPLCFCYQSFDAFLAFTQELRREPAQRSGHRSGLGGELSLPLR